MITIELQNIGGEKSKFREFSVLRDNINMAHLLSHTSPEWHTFTQAIQCYDEWAIVQALLGLSVWAFMVALALEHLLFEC